MSAQPTLLSPLRHETFRLFWIANLSTGLGSHIQAVGAAWLMATISTSADMVALVQTAATLPYMLFSVVAGVIADNFSKKHVILTSVGFMLVTSVLLAAGAFAGVISPVLVLTFTFLIALGSALYYPAMQAAVGEMVPHSHLPAAIALNSLAYNLTRSVGPALGGIIVTFAGVTAAFLFNAVSNISLLWTMFRWKPVAAVDKTERDSFAAAMAGGFHYVRQSPDIQVILLRGFLFGFSAICFLAMLPLIVRDVIGGEAALFGTLSACFGAGAVGGALLGPYLRTRASSEVLARGGFAVLALAAVTCATSPAAVPTAMALFAAGVAWVAIMARLSVNVQVMSPRRVVGRALAFHQMASFGSMAAGSWLWGSLAEAYSVRVAMLTCAGTLAFAGAIGLVRRLSLTEPASFAARPA